jgi:hypothetical protein
VEKTPIYFFSTFGSKINQFERKKSDKNKKIPKTKKLQAITLSSSFSSFILEKSK